MIAKLLEGLFKRVGINAIFAYAIAGVILGPVTGLVEPNRDIQLLLNIGIFIFFFLVGLDELDISGFISAVRGRLFFAAALSVAISMVGCMLVTTDVLFDVGLDLAFTDAMAVAGVLSLSSLGIVAKVLIDRGLPEGAGGDTDLHGRGNRRSAGPVHCRVCHQRTCFPGRGRPPEHHNQRRPAAGGTGRVHHSHVAGLQQGYPTDTGAVAQGVAGPPALLWPAAGAASS